MSKLMIMNMNKLVYSEICGPRVIILMACNALCKYERILRIPKLRLIILAMKSVLLALIRATTLSFSANAEEYFITQICLQPSHLGIWELIHPSVVVTSNTCGGNKYLTINDTPIKFGWSS